MAHALRRPFDIEDGQTGWTVAAGPHETLDIEVNARRAPGHGHTPGEPPFRFLIRYVEP